MLTAPSLALAAGAGPLLFPARVAVEAAFWTEDFGCARELPCRAAQRAPRAAPSPYAHALSHSRSLACSLARCSLSPVPLTPSPLPSRPPALTPGALSDLLAPHPALLEAHIYAPLRGAQLFSNPLRYVRAPLQLIARLLPLSIPLARARKRRHAHPRTALLPRPRLFPLPLPPLARPSLAARPSSRRCAARPRSACASSARAQRRSRPHRRRRCRRRRRRRHAHWPIRRRMRGIMLRARTETARVTTTAATAEVAVVAAAATAAAERWRTTRTTIPAG